MQSLKNWKITHCHIMNRQEVKKHQGKVGVLCGLSLAAVYQGYVSHVLECPGEKSLQQIVTNFDLSYGEKKVRCSQSGSSQKDQQVLNSLFSSFFGN